MPLYGRRLFHPPPSQSQGSFVIPHTGQTFDQADIYQKCVQIYALERWTCECTWRASLTHAEALRSEIEIRRTLTSLVPEHFYKPIFDVIHHNVKPLEKLAEEVSIVLNQSFVLSEPVQFRKKRKDSEVLRGVIERIDDPDESKKRPSIQLTPSSDKQMKNVKYTVRLLDADGTMIEDVSPAELQRTHPVPNREKLKTFIRSFAIRLGTRVDSPWIFYDHSIVSRYKVPSRLPPTIVDQFQKSMTISVDEILREQERLARKQAESVVVVPQPMITESTNNNNDDDDQVIILSDDEDIEKIFPKKFPSVRTFELVVPRAMLNRLDKIRRERGADSKGFQRLILQCARTLSDEQRENFPAEYRSLIQTKVEDLALKQRISQMTDEEKKQFFQTKRDEQKPSEDLDLTQTKDLPEGKTFETALKLSMNSIGDLLMIGTFLNSCQTLFTRTLNDDDLSKFLRSFHLDALLKHFPRSFGKLAQIFLQLLLKEEENRQSIDDERSDNDEASKDTNNNPQTSDFEEIYSTKFTDIPLNAFSLQELIRLFLLKDRPENSAPLVVERLATKEMNELNVDEQIELLKLLVETIYTNNEILSEHQEYLTRILGEAARERHQLLAERREEQNQKKKLRLQNGNETTGDEPDPSTNVNDENDLKTVLQRRRQMLAVSKELKEKKEQQNQKLQIEQRKQLALQRAEQAYQDALLNVQQSFRLKPLGFDRFYNRYWFFRGYAGLFVEKGWSEASSQWFIFDDESQINELIQALNDRGVREHHLLLNLRKSMPLIQHEFEQMKKMKTNSDDEEEEDEEEEGMIASFRSELEEIESRLRLGSLGGWMNNLDELNQWQKNLSKATERDELAELLIQLEETVPEKYSSGIFNQSEKKSLEFWINDCRSCSTYSRLYVLMMVFENAIQWNKSPVGMKCKVCRKKYKDESMFVCDQCYHAYHPQCLKIARPISNDLWYCPACRPEPISKRRHRQESSSSSSSSQEEDEENESASSSPPPSSSRDSSMSDDDPHCSVCGSDGELFSCHQCEQFYHCDCHQPPLRCPPRSNQWLCNTCRTGSKVNKTRKTMTKTTKGKANRKKPEKTSQGRRRSKRLRPSASSSDDGQSMDESDH